MVSVRPLQLESVITTVRDYFITQKTPVKAKTVARCIHITPKQARYVLRKYFDELRITKIDSRKTYYFMK